ncbi:MarR family winged helix-turn-helix transcriptional regulator [Micromonospora sp. DT233]|uniref:MarR family winged helix-turn-helix transcriptional regulator n=1 Tax=Micromonospora sp. DT233 TaxID=3393432 RepID=UPI003CFAF20E
MTTTDGQRRFFPPPIGLLLRKLDGLIDERFECALGNRDISRRQWQLLNMLAEGPATSDALNAAVAPFLDRTTGETVEPHLAPLATRGLVVAATGGAYELTETGRALLESLAEEVRAIRDRTVRGLADGEYDRVVAGLQTMVANLEERA